MKHLINQVLGLAVQIMIHFNGRIKKKIYFHLSLLQNLICIAYDFCMPQSALHNLSDFLHLCLGVESVSKIL